MTTIPVSYPRGTMITLPTKEEWRAMLQKPAVAIVAIIVAGLVVLGFIGACVWLTLEDKGTEALTGAGAIALITALANVLSRLKAVERHVAPGPPTDGAS